ncbi:GNAT family N-acetyltransferase [uncultured Paracoccus sp.]|uniref:GNAT family N-acetyltransferase n=1 Tax=uncultured Paracoccus sp. TaxID=189685 RepID=UPI00260314C7|nr:GNAT family N-acetyltransferase [uncultured Paracoccus sp.]
MSRPVIWREARREDVPAIVAMLSDDMLGKSRESADMSPYLTAFDAMRAEGGNQIIVGDDAGEVMACYQLTFISGLSLTAARRALMEGVRVAASHRGQGIGEAMMQDAENRARAAGCSLIQFTTNKARTDAHRFYDRMGFTPSHIGYKKTL